MDPRTGMIKYSSVKSFFSVLVGYAMVPPPHDVKNSTFSFMFRLKYNQVALILVYSVIQCRNHYRNVCKGVSFGLEKY